MFNLVAVLAIGICAILGPGILMSCGDGKDVIEVREQLKLAQEKLASMKSEVSSNKKDAMELVEQCEADLEDARGLIIEGNLKQASTLIQDVLLKIKPYFEGEAIREVEEQNLAFRDVFGDVKIKKKGQDTFEKIIDQSLPLSGMEVKTGIRSNLVCHTFAGSTIHLHDQSLLELKEIDEQVGKTETVLASGFLTYQHMSDFGTFVLVLDGIEFTVESLAIVEFGSDPISQFNYAAVHRGGAHWKTEGEKSDFLPGNSALVWKDDQRSILPLPLAPLTDSPENHFGFQVDPVTEKAMVRFRWHSMDTSAGYQLQVSESPLFATRIYDNRNLDGAGIDLLLGIGEYFWRVRGIVDNMIPGAFSPVIDFTVRKDEGAAVTPTANGSELTSKGPKISIPKIELIGKVAIVSGRSHPEAVVTVNGVRAVMLDDGYFSVIVNFMREGEQWIEIVARDRQGGENVSRHRVKVTF